MFRRNLSLACAAALSLPLISSAAPLYSDDFEVDSSASWAVNKGGGNNANQYAEFAYDYSALGIPSANGVGGTTKGLRLRANVAGGIFSGLSVSPVGQHFGTSYRLEADVWANYIGSTTTGTGISLGGSSSTQCTVVGVGTAGSTAQWGGGVYDSVFFAPVNDGGTSASDYRIYPKANNAATSTGYYAAGSLSTSAANTDPYYAFLTSHSAPTLQQTTYPATQTNSTPVGIIGFAWHHMVVDNDGTNVRWYIDNTLMGTVPLSAISGGLGGDNILLGEFDTSAASGTGTGADQLNFGLFDNVVVTPEPASLSALGLASVFLRRRR